MMLIKKGAGESSGTKKVPVCGTWILVVTQALISFCGNLQIGLFEDRIQRFLWIRILELDC
jgi:hypothetical protein